MSTPSAHPVAPMSAVASVLVVLFLSAVDATIVGTAMPQVVAAIGGMELFPWAFSAFMLTSTVVMPFYGKFADVYGVRRCLLVAIAVFLGGSLCCGAAQTMMQLVCCRAFQGLGAGGITTLTLISFGLLFAPEVRGRAQGLLSMVWGVAALIGPLAGGLMVTHFPWPWIFWINLPIGLAAATVIATSFPPDAAPPRTHRIVWGDAALLVGGLVALMTAMTGAPVGGEIGPLAIGWPLGIAGLSFFIWRQVHAVEPLVPLHPFRNRLYAGSAALGFGTSLTMFAALSYVPLFVQGVLGRSAPEAGLVLTPMMFAWPLASACAGLSLNRLGFRKLVVAGAVLMGTGYALLATSGSDVVLWQLALKAALLGAGMGLITSTTLVAAQVSVPRHQLGTASSTLGLLRNIGAALGVNLLGGIQLQALAGELHTRGQGLSAADVLLLQQPQTLLEPSAAASLPTVVLGVFRASLGASLELVFFASLAIAFVCIALALRIPPITPKQAAEQARSDAV